MPSINTSPTAGMHSHHGHALKSPPAQKLETSEASPRPSTAPATEIRESHSPREKGVLRLLEEGHFSGVAAIRLRINFHADLQEKDAAAQTEATRSAATQLRTDMAAVLAKIGDELDASLVEPVEEMFSQFDQAVSNSLDDEAAAGSDIHATVANALATLREGLANLLGEDESLTPPDSSVIGETEDVITNALGEAGTTDETTSDPTTPQPIGPRILDDIDQLTSAFEETASSVTQLSSIEGITPPSGNGVAFEKFIEQYRAQFASGVDQDAELPRVDEQA